MRWKRVVAAVGLVTGASRMVDFVEGIGSHEAGAAPAVAQGPDTADARPLVRDDRGADVIRWQDDLNDWIAVAAPHLPPVTVDGVFGPHTEEATRAFQDVDPRVPTDLRVDRDDQVALARAIADA